MNSYCFHLYYGENFIVWVWNFSSERKTQLRAGEGLGGDPAGGGRGVREWDMATVKDLVGGSASKGGLGGAWDIGTPGGAVDTKRGIGPPGGGGRRDGTPGATGVECGAEMEIEDATDPLAHQLGGGLS